jgi:transcriptional regulator with XRE-family HTH domain
LADLDHLYRLASKIAQNAHERLGGWEAVGRAFGISPAAAWKIAKGQMRPSKATLAKMGLLLTRSAKRVEDYPDLFSMPVAVLAWALRNREPMPELEDHVPVPEPVVERLGS